MVTKAEYTATGKMFDIGRSTYDAINRIIGGINPVDAGGKSDMIMEMDR